MLNRSLVFQHISLFQTILSYLPEQIVLKSVSLLRSILNPVKYPFHLFLHFHQIIVSTILQPSAFEVHSLLIVQHHILDFEEYDELLHNDKLHSFQDLHLHIHPYHHVNLSSKHRYRFQLLRLAIIQLV